MSPIRGVVRNGRVETRVPLSLPEGTEILIVPEQTPDREDDWDNSPGGIATWLEWYDSLEPLMQTDQELAALQADREARSAWEKAQLEAHADRLRSLWE
jgi:hypothetical protein